MWTVERCVFLAVSWFLAHTQKMKENFREFIGYRLELAFNWLMPFSLPYSGFSMLSPTSINTHITRDTNPKRHYNQIPKFNPKKKCSIFY